VTPLAAPVVDWATLGEVVLYSLAAGVGVAVCFSLAIVGATRFTERLRDGGTGVAAIAYAALATLGMAATVAAVVIGIVVMTSKG
jgi:hypothetical protein